MSHQASDLYNLPARRSEATTTFILGLLLVAAALYLSLIVASSWLAHRLAYPQAFGPPIFSVHLSLFLRTAALAASLLPPALCLLSRSWRLLPALLTSSLAVWLATTFPLYPPSAYLTARAAFDHSAYAPIASTSTQVAIYSFLLVTVAAGILFYPYFASLFRPNDLHGSAKFATAREAAAAGFTVKPPSLGLSPSTDIPIGIIEEKGRKLEVRVTGDSHFLVVAPPGAGKSTGLAIPLLQDWQGPAIVLDVKGELREKTAGHRHQHGSQILTMDPSRVDPSLVCYNPLLSVRAWPYDVTDVTTLCQILVPDKHSGDPFWGQAARTLLEGVLLHVLYLGPTKTLGACYRFLCDPVIPLEDQFEAMLVAEHDPTGAPGWRTHPRVAMSARTFIDMPGVTRGGVIAQAQASLAPYADPTLDRATSTSDFALEDLFTPRARPVTLYLVIDPNSLHRLSPHVRIFISQLTSAMTRQLPNRRSPSDRCLMLLDEFPTFGKMEALETALAYLRGYGVQVYIVCQHLGQLNQAYGNYEGISPNCAVHLAFAPAHLDTAKALSSRAGTQTVVFSRGSISSQGVLRSSRSQQTADSGRPLIAPDEILRLPKGVALVLRTGSRPLLVRPVPYYADPLRVAAARLPVPPSEPTNPDYGHWLNRPSAPPPVPKGRREQRLGLQRAAPILDPGRVP
jgi:type IV secretion system protein VirD4